MVLRYGLKRQDYRILSQTLPTIVGIVPVRELMQEVRHLQYTLNSRIVGCTPDYLTMNHLQMDRGRFLSDKDLNDIANVCVLAFDTADRLFPIQTPYRRVDLHPVARAY